MHKCHAKGGRDGRKGKRRGKLFSSLPLNTFFSAHHPLLRVCGASKRNITTPELVGWHKHKHHGPSHLVLGIMSKRAAAGRKQEARTSTCMLVCYGASTGPRRWWHVCTSACLHVLVSSSTEAERPQYHPFQSLAMRSERQGGGPSHQAELQYTYEKEPPSISCSTPLSIRMRTNYWVTSKLFKVSFQKEKRASRIEILPPSIPGRRGYAR